MLCCLITLLPALAGCSMGRRGAHAHRVTGDASCEAVAAASVPQRLPPAQRDTHTVLLASYTQEPDELPVPPDPDPSRLETTPPEVVPSPTALDLHDVIVSVQQTYPLLVSVMLERQIADGKQQSAWGAFDLGVKAFGIAAPYGFYKTYRNGIALDQPMFGGGYLYGGYKIGDGNFEPWYGERETNEGGEFAAGFGVPLLKDRSIDKRREALFKAGLARQAVEPAIRAELLEFVRVASRGYWTWVAAGQTVEAQRELLRLAVARVEQVEERVNAGDLARIAHINNDQLIAARETKVIEAERKLQEAAIKLSLFLRNLEGRRRYPASHSFLKISPRIGQLIPSSWMPISPAPWPLVPR